MSAPSDKQCVMAENLPDGKNNYITYIRMYVILADVRTYLP